LIGSFYNNKLFLGLYNTEVNEIVPLTKNILQDINDDIVILLAHRMGVAANRFFKGIFDSGNAIKNSIVNTSFENYKIQIEKSGRAFYHTYELEFINGYKDFILSDEQLKQSIVEK
jgi:hypothetical protein